MGKDAAKQKPEGKAKAKAGAKAKATKKGVEQKATAPQSGEVPTTKAPSTAQPKTQLKAQPGLSRWFSTTAKGTPPSAKTDEACVTPPPEVASLAPALEAVTPASHDEETPSANQHPEALSEIPAATTQAETPARTAPEGVAGSPTSATTGSSPGSARELTQEQKDRIAANKREALERLKQKRAQEAASALKTVQSHALKAELDSYQFGAPSTAAESPPSKKLAIKGKDSGPKKADVPTPEKPPSPAVRHASIAASRPVDPAHAASSPPTASVNALRGVPSPLQRGTGRFESLGKAPWQQYHSAYTKRLQALRGRVCANARSQWSDVPHQNVLTSIRDYKLGGAGKDVVLIGVLFKDMKARPNVIEQYKESKVCGLPQQEDKSKNLCSDEDALFLEDEAQRLCLGVSVQHAERLATGMVAAVRGTPSDNGTFNVVDVVLAQSSLPIAELIEKPAEDAGDFIAFVSGLRLGAVTNNDSARARAIDFLAGQCDRKQLKQLSSSVKRVIVCGGTFAKGGAADALSDADSIFAQLAAVLPVDVMPGCDDPTNLSLPQMGLHPFLLPRARACRDFGLVTNPHEWSLEGLRVLGHAGQPVDDLLRCTRLGTPLAALEATWTAQHLAPTAPDTLPSPPFTDADPFIIEAASSPDIFFSAGHEKAEHKWFPASQDGKGTLCLCVPAFSKEPAVILVNIKDTRDVRVLSFAGAA